MEGPAGRREDWKMEAATLFLFLASDDISGGSNSSSEDSVNLQQ